ncbi:alpha/beta fold hydrolase [Anaerobacillus sp. 1_MG-2023]|uniref:alpha/beta fold hydrolase n=1 Tax=Anaerobacillus sp. 1_MG-2023 TaxID=3062655 RepID=UPI0026E36F26|nr:alpha/beta hydrolase [Anaerobacillus sp. 1_MG-2023]MDO6655477.1 alpha/beta hydrolase [Anaerobacillus sp. 1_MG-2023]
MINIKKLVDIGDKELEVWMKGNGRTIIIQPGMISPLSEWNALWEDLSRHARVIIYNRAGCGKSDKGITTRNRRENAKDLNALIKKLSVTSPIIIGHSYGGLILQQFAQEYPNVASGFVLVDSTSFDAYMLDEVEIEGEDGNSTEAWIEKCKTYSGLSKKHLQLEMADWVNELKEILPSISHKEVEKFMSNPTMFESLSEELEFDLLSRETNYYKAFPDTFTIVIGRDPKVSIIEMVESEGLHKSEAEDIENIWQNLIRNQTKLNSNTKYILAKESGHRVHLENPEVIKRAVDSIFNSIKVKE